MRYLYLFYTLLIVAVTASSATIGVADGTTMTLYSVTDIFTSEGVTIVDATIPADSSIDALYLQRRSAPYSALEVTWLQEFVENGGIVIVPGEWGTLPTMNNNQNDLLTDPGWNTGIYINTTCVVDSVHYYPGTPSLFNPYCWISTDNIWPDPLMFGIEELAFIASSFLSVEPPAQICARTMGTACSDSFPFDVAKVPLIAYTQIGSGMVIVTGDCNIITVSGGVLTHEAWDSSDNDQFIRNICYYINGGVPGVAEASRPESPEISVYPNPFNSSCSITGQGSVEIIDMTGRLIDQIELPCMWTPKDDLPSGTYLVRATVGGVALSKRVVYLK